jgi:L-alanine-DL-glutamate epimerase-like enolase superfamily enzyme
MLYDRVADLEFHIDEYELAGHERMTSSGFERMTTAVSLHGEGQTGLGEDVTYENAAHRRFLDSTRELPATGTYTIEEFSDRVSELDLFADSAPDRPVFRNYRQWAFESAALDLALKQAGLSLADCLDREYDPVGFVVSTRLDDPPTGERVLDWLDRDPTLGFKLDPTDDWTPALVDRLAETDAVRILDLKGQYSDTVVDQSADADLYERVLDAFPDALIEDPELTAETRPLFEDERGRVSWDEPVHGVETVEDLPWDPDWLNIKPSRFGTVESLLATLEYCRDHDIRTYGGGQFELGVGRSHLHALASLFYPDAPNDIAPRVYNVPDPGDDPPSSPLDPPVDPVGLAWS